MGLHLPSEGNFQLIFLQNPAEIIPACADMRCRLLQEAARLRDHAANRQEER